MDKDPIRSDKWSKLQGLARAGDLHFCLKLREGNESLLALLLAPGKARNLLSDIESKMQNPRHDFKNISVPGQLEDTEVGTQKRPPFLLGLRM